MFSSVCFISEICGPEGQGHPEDASQIKRGTSLKTDFRNETK